MAAAVAPFTSTSDPSTNSTSPPASLAAATAGVARSPSSKSPSSSEYSEAVRISQIRLIAVPTSRARPACQVRRPPEAMPHTAIETPSSRGTSLRTRRLLTRSGTTRALRPSTTNTLKMLLPTTLLTAMASPPLKVEIRLTNNSGVLVPRETTVRPITIWGIPSNRARAEDPATKSSPPPNKSTMPRRISRTLGR